MEEQMKQNENFNQSNDDVKFCKHCGKKISGKAVICPLCGCQVEEFNNSQKQSPIVINNTNTNTAVATATANAGVSGRPKNKWVALILCIFLGLFGAHKFYEEKAGMGVLYLFTGGLFCIGWIIDIIALIFKPTTYYV